MDQGEDIPPVGPRPEPSTATAAVEEDRPSPAVATAAATPTFPCAECPYVGTSEGTLKTHIRRRHTDEGMMFQCEGCQKAYQRRDYLTRHQAAKPPCRGTGCKKIPRESYEPPEGRSPRVPASVAMPPPPSPVMISSDETPPATPGPKVPRVTSSDPPRFGKAPSGKSFKKTPRKPLMRSAERTAAAKHAPYAARPVAFTPPREARPRSPPSAARGRPLSPEITVLQPTAERPPRSPPTAAQGIPPERRRPETPPPQPR